MPRAAEPDASFRSGQTGHSKKEGYLVAMKTSEHQACAPAGIYANSFNGTFGSPFVRKVVGRG